MLSDTVSPERNVGHISGDAKVLKGKKGDTHTAASVRGDHGLPEGIAVDAVYFHLAQRILEGLIRVVVKIDIESVSPEIVFF